MRTFIAALLAASVLVPSVASAQADPELRRDRRDIAREQRDLDRAYRRGDPRDIRDQRGDVRDARREYREDLRDRGRPGPGRDWGRDDWRGWRDRNRSLYARGDWRAPFRYNSFRAGGRIGAPYYGQRYWVSDYGRYHLRRPIGAQRWVRHYNDVLLVDTRRGVVLDVIRGFYW